MPEKKLGIKRTCLDCGAKFFDLGRNRPECPKCGAISDGSETKPAMPLEKNPSLAGEPAPKAAPEDPLDPDGVDGGNLEGIEGEETLADAEDDDTLIEDASDLGRDADDISEVMEHIDEAVEDTT